MYVETSFRPVNSLTASSGVVRYRGFKRRDVYLDARLTRWEESRSLTESELGHKAYYIPESQQLEWATAKRRLDTTLRDSSYICM